MSIGYYTADDAESVGSAAGHLRTARAAGGPPTSIVTWLTFSAATAKALQRERLPWSVRHAYEDVEHYRKSFDAAGVHPDDIRVLEDLAKLPITSKADLREHYPFGMFAVPR